MPARRLITNADAAIDKAKEGKERDTSYTFLFLMIAIPLILKSHFFNYRCYH
jgi:hypothetical protein